MPNFDNIAWPGWETVRLIGRGSFGAVYEIRRDVLGRTESAALKVLSIPQDQSDVEELYGSGYDEASITAHYQSYLADIVKEYQLMVAIKGHTNVVNCEDIRYVQKDSGIGWDIFIKMELLTPMMKALDRMRDERQILKLGLDMANALVLCRNRNIIHRDIKPQNIFLSADGDFKLGDFGIAKTAEKTCGGTKIGTYNYMAPEVYNNRPYGHSSDIYSLGMVLYWLLNERRLPFYPLPPAVPTSTEMDKARLRRFRGEPLPPPAHGSPALKQIVMKAVAYEPAERYQRAEDMLWDLRELERLSETGTASRESRATDGVFSAGGGAAEEGTVGVFTGGSGIADRVFVEPAEAFPRGARFGAQEAEEGTVSAFGGTARVTLSRENAPEGPANQNRELRSGERRTPPNPVPGGIPGNGRSEGPAAPPPKPKKRGKIGLIVGLCLLALLAAAAVGFFTIHSWQPATCTEPETCSICGRTRGMALGHDWAAQTCTEPETCRVCGETRSSARDHEWQPATCTEPETCRVCGLTRGSPLGHVWSPASCSQPETCTRCGQTRGSPSHDWEPATYDRPETCRICGKTNGSPKGYVGKVSWTIGDRVKIHGNTSTWAMELSEPVNNCMKITVRIKLYNVSGSPYGEWYFFGRDLNGKWQNVGQFTMTRDCEGAFQEYVVTLKGTPSFDAVIISPIYDSGWSASWDIEFIDVQEYVG